MTRHPFFNLHIDLLNQIYLIYRIEHLEKSRFITMKNKQRDDQTINSMDVSFSTQINTDKTSWVDMPDIVPAVGQFVDILIDVKLDWILNQKMPNPRIEIEYISCRLSCNIPT